MGVTPVDAPAASVDEFRSTVAPAGPDDHRPHKIFELTLSDVVRGAGTDDLVCTGWRYVFRTEDGAYRAAEVSASGREHVFDRLDDGPHVDSFVTLLRSLEEHHLVVEHDYEVSVLRVPSCRVQAIWLRGDDHDHQMAVPLVAVPDRLEAGRSYTMDELMDVVRRIARERIMAESDLTCIEGIGPQIEELLHEAGVADFAELAGSEPDILRATLKSGGSRFHRADPQTWPEQAALAARGRWDELDRLQATLTGGRRARG